MTEPSASGASAANASGVQTAPPTARSTSAIAHSAAAPQIHISVSNVRRKPGLTSCPCPDCARPGSANIGSAPGGYSSRKSRYGTFPYAISFPYLWYTGVSMICLCR